MLQNTLERLNEIATFLFINAKAKARFISLTIDYQHDPALKVQAIEILRAKQIYEIQIKRFLFGLGFFLSFIPGTEAYAARMDLYNILLKLPTTILINTGFLEFHKPLSIGLFHAIVNRSYMPLTDMIKETILRQGIKPWLNPLNLFQYIGGIIIYLGNRIQALQRLGKARRPILNFLFIPLVYSVGALTAVTELLLTTIDTLIFDPIRFVCEEIKQAYDFWGKEFTYLPTNEAKLIEKIADALEEPKDKTDFHIATDKKTLRILNKEAKKQETVHLNSLFFKKYKDEPELPFKDEKTIAKAYNAYTNSQHFFVFNTAQKTLPKEVANLITNTCMKEFINQSSESTRSNAP